MTRPCALCGSRTCVEYGPCEGCHYRCLEECECEICFVCSENISTNMCLCPKCPECSCTVEPDLWCDYCMTTLIMEAEYELLWHLSGGKRYTEVRYKYVA